MYVLSLPSLTGWNCSQLLGSSLYRSLKARRLWVSKNIVSHGPYAHFRLQINFADKSVCALSLLSAPTIFPHKCSSELPAYVLGDSLNGLHPSWSMSYGIFRLRRDTGSMAKLYSTSLCFLCYFLFSMILKISQKFVKEIM